MTMKRNLQEPMPPESEAAPTPQYTWQELLEHSRVTKSEIRKSLNHPFQKTSLIKTENGYKIFALGTPTNSHSQTILSADLPKEVKDEPLVVEFKPVLKQDPFIFSLPSVELAMMCERQRSSAVVGINEYKVCGNDMILIGGDRIFKYSINKKSLEPVRINAEGKPSPLDTSSNSSLYISDAKICPCDHSVAAYVVNKQIYIEKNGRVIYKTPAKDHVTNGVPSYICLEELERFEAIWWSDTQMRLLYERVDESMVPLTSFGVNGKGRPEFMRYPRTGTRNAQSSLRMIVIEGEQVFDVPLKRELHVAYPRMEYITRAGFFSDGKTVYVELLSRQQNEGILVLIPETDFELPAEVPVTVRDPPPMIDADYGNWDEKMTIETERCEKKLGTIRSSLPIFKQSSEYWINVHNAFHALRIEDEEEPEYRFIYCVEKPLGTCLVLVATHLDEHGAVRRVQRMELMQSNHSLCKSIQVRVDETRKLVYYVANQSSPIEWNVCVSSYSDKTKPITRRLTEAGFSVRYERANPSLTLDFDMGFVCWVNSYSHEKNCRVYRFEHSFDYSSSLDEFRTPKAFLAANLVLPGQSIGQPIRIGLPEYIEYTSERTGLKHYGLIIRPDNFDDSKKYPVLQYVYGGPGIQLIRNDYAAWMPYIKYSRLGYVVVIIDNRGSANRGIEFEGHISRRLGFAEVDDQVDGLKAIAERTGGIMDLSRVVVHGWSYGGYMALMMIAKHGDIYRGAIAGGAVTDWRLYDTAYTERYMGYPVYPEIYFKSSIINLVECLPEEPNRLLLIHGLLDENVHFSHIANLIDCCIKKGKPHDLLVLPNERHGIRSADAASYVDAKMMYFMQKTLNEPVAGKVNNENW